MRDTNENMIEILDAINSSENYFALISHTINDEKLTLRFGIDKIDFAYLKRLLEFRPFENTGVGKYKYFFTFGYSNNSENKNLLDCNIRVEQLRTHKQFKLLLTKRVVSNFLWFNELKDTEKIKEMIIN